MKVKLLNDGSYGGNECSLIFPLEVDARETELGYEVTVGELKKAGFVFSLEENPTMTNEDELFFFESEVEVIS